MLQRQLCGSTAALAAGESEPTLSGQRRRACASAWTQIATPTPPSSSTGEVAGPCASTKVSAGGLQAMSGSQINLKYADGGDALGHSVEDQAAGPIQSGRWDGVVEDDGGSLGQRCDVVEGGVDGRTVSVLGGRFWMMDRKIR